jgi:beta-lactamase class A
MNIKKYGVRTAVAVLGLLALTAASHASGQEPSTQQGFRDQFASRLEQIAAGLDGAMGYSVVDLTSGERFERLAGQAFPTASTIKLAILYELFRQVEEGRVSLDSAPPIDPARVVGGSGVLQHLTTVRPSLRDCATLMIVLSDNTATNVLIDALGMDRVRGRMQSLGIPDVRLRRHMMDGEAARRGDENVASPAGIATLLAAIHRGEQVSPASRDAMIEMLQKEKSSPMLLAIPPGVPAATKPGELDAVRVDAGIVYVPDRPYVFVAMTSWLGKDEDGERAITAASRAAYEYFSRLAASSEYGRRMR